MFRLCLAGFAFGLYSEGVLQYSPGLPRIAATLGTDGETQHTLKGFRHLGWVPMSQSLSNILVHIVFSTKDRIPFLRNPMIRNELHAELGATSNSVNCPTIIVGGIADHIHMLARQSRTISLADWIKELKRVTSIWIKQLSPEFEAFAWQAGYGAFSVSQSQSGNVNHYIKEQEIHHQKMDFKTEFREFLERHQIEYDERYVWD